MPRKITRRDLLGVVGAAALTFAGKRPSAQALAGALPQSTQAAGGARHPSVLFIAIDDLNDWIGVMGGHPQSRTPNIDRLAARGMLFTNAHCAAPACNPSRAALMTGRRPTTSGVYHNSQVWRLAMPDAVTIPQHFRANGYMAMGSGKIFHKRVDPASWDVYYPSLTQQKFESPTGGVSNVNGLGLGSFDWSPIDTTEEQMGDARTATWVSARLEEKHDKPLFLACGIYLPHLAWYVPKKYFEAFPLSGIQRPKVRDDDLDDVPPAGRGMANAGGDHRAVMRGGQWDQAVQGYLTSISFADAQVGKVLDALDRGPHRDNTLVVLWGDNGWHLGEKQHWRKFTLWERSTRVPLIVMAPGVTQAATQCGQPVSLMDLYPTLIELCGLPARPDVEGRSLLPLLRNPSAAWEGVALTTQMRGNHAVRDARYRYIRYSDGTEELYDHATDPNEWTNLANRDNLADVKTRLAKHLPASEKQPAEKGKKKPE